MRAPATYVPETEIARRASGAIWLAAATGLTETAIAVLRALWPKHNARRLDVSPVSDHWLAEHRVGSNDGVSV